MIVKYLEEIAKLNDDIRNIKQGINKNTNEKARELTNNFLKNFNSEDFAKQLTNIMIK